MEPACENAAVARYEQYLPASLSFSGDASERRSLRDLALVLFALGSVAWLLRSTLKRKAVEVAEEVLDDLVDDLLDGRS